MTLLCSYSIGGIASVLTCDTRRTMTLGKMDIPISDADSKIHQITDSIVCAGGGSEAITDFVIRLLKKKLSKPIQTLRIESVIEDIDEDVQDTIKKHLKKGDPAQILITGFNVLGTWFTLNYVPTQDKEERIFYQVLRYGELTVSGAFPEGYEGELKSLKEASSHIHVNMTETEIAQTLLLSIANLQQAIYSAEPDKVSESLCYSIVLRDKGTNTPVVVSNKVNIISSEGGEEENE